MASTGTKRWLSPLRYPGSKRRFVPYIRKVIEDNGLSPDIFVEPFAGGASAALQLVGEGTVPRIGLADKDPLVSSFWKTLFRSPEWLIEKIKSVDVNLSTWKQYKEVARSETLAEKERGFACLYLNRTSYSGIIHEWAGPLGGESQDSKYTIECRFPKEKICDRIRDLKRLGDRVEFTWNTGWRQTLGMIRTLYDSDSGGEEVFYYFDPPFFEKAERLYSYSFEESDHARLRDELQVSTEAWLLSYDACPEVERYYGPTSSNIATIEAAYGPPGEETGKVEEAMLTNLTYLPRRVVLWRKNGRRGLLRRTDGG